MQLRSPVQIAPNLEAGLRVGDSSWLTIDYAKRPGRDGRTRYRYTIIRDGQPDITDDNLRSGCQGGSLQEGLESLCSYLGAFAESWNYAGADGESADLFPTELAEWACEHSDEISMLGLELEETPNLIEE